MSTDHESKSPTPPPAFDIQENSKLSIKQTPIIGELPPNFASARNGAEIHISDSIFTRSPEYIEFPEYDGKLSDSTLDELASILESLKPDLIALNKAYTTYPDPFEEWDIAHLTEKSNTVNNTFNIQLRDQAYALFGELTRRTPPIKRYGLPNDMRCGIDAVLYRKLTGNSPVLGIINFGEMLLSLNLDR